MRIFNVTGMSCAACSSRVEKVVAALDGVSACNVSLLTNSMSVEGTASDDAIIAAVSAAGYGASPKGASVSQKQGSDELDDKEFPALKRRLISSLIFLSALMYISMGAMMWGWPLPDRLANDHIGQGILQLLLTTAVMVINKKFFVSGIKGAINRAPNMDTLVALGAAAAYGYSIAALFGMTGAAAAGDHAGAMHFMHEFYFESAAMILTLITVGKMLEARAKGRTTDALRGLMDLAPKTATILRGGSEVVVPIEEVARGDIFVVRPGESVPVDGVVIDGSSAIDESALTGESMPVDKAPGDKVSSATINRSGFIKCEASRVGEDTTLAQVIKMVSDAAATKAPIAKIADRVSGVFVPIVITIAAITAAVWLALGDSVGSALGRGIAVLVISCPCALGLATPVAIMVGSGVGARAGILFKTAASLEAAGRVQIAALDKTGTITSGRPEVTDVVAAEGVSARELLEAACSIESKSEHPLAGAVMRKAEAEGIAPRDVADFSALPGSGLRAVIDGEEMIAGSFAFVSSRATISDEMRKTSEELASRGRTPLFFARAGEILGMIAAADAIKDDSPRAVRELQGMGIKVVMLTGDNERTARAIGKEAGVDDVISGVMPDGKESVIRRLAEHGRVAMVGDGINDAPALTRADVGIAIGAGTDIAIDAADVVLMKSRLSDVPAAIRLGRATLRNIRENLFWAFCYNVLGIPLAAGIFASLLGWKLDPMFGAAAMSLSSFCVVTNALRLNFFKIFDASRDHRAKSVDLPTIAADHHERALLRVDGMMCEHCENAVRRALEKLDFVASAAADHKSGTVRVDLSGAPIEEAIRSALKEEDYDLISIE